MTTTVQRGDVLTLTAQVRDSAGVLADATTVTCSLTQPDVSDYGAVAVTHSTTGTYVASVAPVLLGRHQVYWVATGSNASADVEAFDCVAATWLQPADVAGILRLSPTDSRLDAACAAAQAFVERHRWDLAFPVDATSDIVYGAAKYAARLVNEGGAVTGIPDYESQATYGAFGGMADVYRLIGDPPPGIA